jgi:hypothetical protein
MVERDTRNIDNRNNNNKLSRVTSVPDCLVCSVPINSFHYHYAKREALSLLLFYR